MEYERSPSELEQRIKKIGERYVSKITFLSKEFCELCEAYNRGYEKSDEIMLGIFDDDTNMLLGFFHEIGHHFIYEIYKQKKINESLIKAYGLSGK